MVKIIMVKVMFKVIFMVKIMVMVMVKVIVEIWIIATVKIMVITIKLKGLRVFI
jgi:hypothetical protein